MENTKKSILVGSLIIGAITGASVSNKANSANFIGLGSGAEIRTSLLNHSNGSTSNLFLELTCGEKNTDTKSKDAKCGEGKCGEKKTDTKSKDAKCGEGKCGEKKTDSKSKDAKCGEGKCGEKKTDAKSKDASCGTKK